MNNLAIYTVCTCLMLLLFIMVNAYMDYWTNRIFIVAIFAVLLLLFIPYEEHSFDSSRHTELKHVIFIAIGYSIKPIISYLFF